MLIALMMLIVLMMFEYVALALAQRERGFSTHLRNEGLSHQGGF